MKTIFIGALSAMLSLTAFNSTAIAADEHHLATAIKPYVASRVAHDHGLMIRVSGEPFRAAGVINGREWRGMALKVRLNAMVAPGRRTGFYRDVVLLGPDGPVAFKSDASKFKAVE